VVGGPRRGFDYDAFEARLESLWFQRRALVTEGREVDAAQQGRQIRSFCAEEGVGRLEPLAAALLVEADRYHRQGDYARALGALELAEAFDPDRPQTHWATARILWESRRSRLGAATRAAAALRAALVRSVHDLTIVQPLPVLLVVALALGCAIFALAMMLRYQIPLRHEIEEWLQHAAHERLARAGGLAVLFLPLLIWIGAGWLLVYWLVVTFRYMARSERIVTLAVLSTLALLDPAHRFAAAIYGATTDPVVRTTLAAADGSYAPDRIVKLRGLIDAHPDDPVYRFLIAGLYKNGRYFEEAFEEYKHALLLAPRLVPAHINIGNIFYTTGQYGEAIANYHRALDVEPESLLALFNLHLAQSEAFRFQEAETSLTRARAIDPSELARLFTAGREGAERASVVDARIEGASLWHAAVDPGLRSAGSAPRRDPRALLAAGLVTPTALGAFGAVGACLLALWTALRQTPGRRCSRCGQPFCATCCNSRDNPDLCSQCMHLFVLGDGLAPETKSVKLFQIERYRMRIRWTRRVASWLLPGAGQLLGGRPARGLLFATVWLTAWVVVRPTLLAPLERALRFDTGLSGILARALPSPFAVDVLALLALGVLVATWLAANLGRTRAREA